jgi:hypothetical protein
MARKQSANEALWEHQIAPVSRRTQRPDLGSLRSTEIKAATSASGSRFNLFDGMDFLRNLSNGLIAQRLARPSPSVPKEWSFNDV